MPGRTVSWAFIGLYLVAHAAWSIAMNLGFRADVVGLNTLTANLLALLLLVTGLLFLVGQLKPSDVGLRAKDLLGGLLFTALYFALLQAALVGYANVTGLQVVNQWARLGAATATYLLVAQFIGNALYEEVAFRGFLLPQLFIKFRRLGVAVGLVVAAVTSQALFALAHVPNRLWVTGLAPTELPMALLPLLILGLYFALLYLLTDNLLAVVGVHALNNEPLLALVGAGGGTIEGPHTGAAVVISLLLAVVWRLLRRAARARQVTAA